MKKLINLILEIVIRNRISQGIKKTNEPHPLLVVTIGKSLHTFLLKNGKCFEER
jgi:ethanolamine utilization protein EutA (predicted chaperonin)